MTQHNTTARASRRADGHFTTIANAAIRDPRLSWKAKGVLAGALSHGPGFRFNREWFVLNGTDGGAAIRSAFQELRDHGYLITERIVGPDGKFKGGSLHFSDDPSLLPEEENHKAGNRVADFPPGGEPATIRRSIERRPTEEDQEELDPFPASGEHTDGLTPRQRGTNPRAKGTNPRATGTSPRALGTNPRAVREAEEGMEVWGWLADDDASGGTVVADPHPQRPEPAPSPPKRQRMAKRKPKEFMPVTDDVPASLLPVEAELRAFWEVKAGGGTYRAWKCLTGELERIWRHPDGGIEVVRDQINWGIQREPESLTFANWLKYGQTAPARAGGGPRKSATDQAADNVLAMFAARGIA